MSIDKPISVAEMSAGTPSSEIEIDVALVRSLLLQQHPDLANLPLHAGESGWDNMLLRLGDKLAVRLPRRSAAAILIKHEQRWLPEIAPHLPLPIPVPLRLGVPGCGYPWHWSVVPWFPGNPSDLAKPNADQGPVLSVFLRALHLPAPTDLPLNPYRGVPLRQRLSVTEERFERVGRLTDCVTQEVREIWNQALNAPIDVAPTWIHGDLHSRNVLVKHGAFCAVIDWGDLAQGDRATDLAAIWTLLPDVTSRLRAMQSYGDTSGATWLRAKGWAVMFGLMLIDSGIVNDARLASAGEATLRRLTEGP